MTPYASPIHDGMTTAQVRDRVELAAIDPDTTVKDVHLLKREYLAEKDRRGSCGDYVECPRCREDHNDKTTFKGICHICRLTLLDNFPHHPFTLEMEKHDGFIRSQ